MAMVSGYRVESVFALPSPPQPSAARLEARSCEPNVQNPWLVLKGPMSDEISPRRIPFHSRRGVVHSELVAEKEHFSFSCRFHRDGGLHAASWTFTVRRLWPC